MSTEQNGNLEARFRNQLSDKSREELIDLFNREVGNTGWVSARSIYLIELRRAIQKAGIDCSIVLNESGGFNLKRRVKLSSDKLEFSSAISLRKLTGWLKFRYYLLLIKAGVLPNKSRINLSK